ncbi:MAG: hypothetical protein NTX64_07095 [Elusimicrobia bacterium]|nr:hypothetical protein [Elusimicrobiota bacterium]
MILLSAALSLAFAVRPACASDLESAYARQSVSVRTVSQTMQERQKTQPRRLEVSPDDLNACQELVAKQPVSYGGWDLRMVTDSAAYYTHQDCDICDSLDMCDFKTHQLSNLKTAHMVDCEDINQNRKGTVIYSDCEGRPAYAILGCSAAKNAVPAFTAVLNLATMDLADSRSGGNSRRFDAAQANVVDERCGTPRAPLAETLNFEVTPTHYWGQDILQLPKAIAAPGPSSFSANLHLCQYDGDWSSFEDVELQCTITKRN